ncbi:hypothetical protein CY34DRAFT_10064 [Suillus luteus UH-Slu-Lm8-n1]|uniref:Secreted protein n=1 Tax=Suillus luteus UH-Slu-Lm8-n1 TaxID=930992 RepID=A0A0D0AVX3_9AGAM|nr:hypothetical protein CY34DRAFT_10064 [Suillus luteus UH-Slu-Lm8-n1]
MSKCLLHLWTVLPIGLPRSLSPNVVGGLIRPSITCLSSFSFVIFAERSVSRRQHYYSSCAACYYRPWFTRSPHCPNITQGRLCRMEGSDASYDASRSLIPALPSVSLPVGIVSLGEPDSLSLASFGGLAEAFN